MISKSELRKHKKYYSVTNLERERGKHRIYIGMAPGVGKTYRMLQEANSFKEDGIDVVIGLLETHGRDETAAVANGLEIVPRQQITRGGIILTEMDTDAILKRQPQLVLVDELAHTNIPGSKYKKRYQDVEEILQAGIDVFSTVNIQHLESLNDIVSKLTGVVVRERIPDRVLDEADEVIVVDVTPETLQERLRDGKIYAKDKIERSLQNFFQRRKLVALRELALREVADNLDEIMDATEESTYSVKERVLVCISTNPNSSRLLRRGARLASQMRGKLYGLYVNHPEYFLSKESSLYLEMCEELCHQFGGEFLQISSTNVTQTIAQVAHQYRITQIVLGQTQKSRWQLLFKGSPVQELMRHLQDVDLHIIGTEQ